MFLDNSRYTKIPTVTATTADGRTVTALSLRPLPAISGNTHAVIDNDRLDLLASASCGDATKFWHVADANTALDAARELIAKTGDTLNLPPT